MTIVLAICKNSFIKTLCLQSRLQRRIRHEGQNLSGFSRCNVKFFLSLPIMECYVLYALCTNTQHMFSKTANIPQVLESVQ